MSEPSKDTIYVDIDDEITGVINKVRESDKRVIALVLPKRAAVLQSIVNMKLLKRAADDSKKSVVLITSEAGLLPLAGAVGFYVAKTLQTKPALPEGPEIFEGANADEAVDVDNEDHDFDPREAAEKPIGELAGSATKSKPSAMPSPDETIELNEDELAAAGTIAEAREENKKEKKKKKDKKLKVPNFIRFRRLLIVGVGVFILLIIGFIILAKVLPKAVVNIQTNNSSISSSLTLNLSTSAKTLDPVGLTVPAVAQQVTKTSTAQVPTTGQQNNGQQATGQVTLSLNDCSQQQTIIPGGTGISSGGLTFITQSTVTLDSVTIGKQCNPQQSSNFWSSSVNVTAQQGGSKYNLGPSTFVVAGFANVAGQSTTAFSGGTDSVINIVSQADITNASQKITAPAADPIEQALENDLTQAGLTPITETFNTGTPVVTTTPAVGTQANNVTATESITYTMFGVHQSDLVTLIDNSVNSQINSSQQSIIDNGVSKASYNVLNQSASTAQITMQTSSTVGSQLNISTIKSQIVGKKSGDVQTLIKAYPGVQNVTVKLSPFWVTTVPSVSKTTITIQNASGS